MAEYCLDCWNRLNKSDDKAERYVLSDELDLCEGYGELKHVIVKARKHVLLRRLMRLLRTLE